MLYQLRKKFADDANVLLFSQKYTAGYQLIRVFSNNGPGNFNAKLALDFLTNLQIDFGQNNDGQWTPFCLGVQNMLDGCVCFSFLSRNPKEKEMYDSFCKLAIS